MLRILILLLFIVPVAQAESVSFLRRPKVKVTIYVSTQTMDIKGGGLNVVGRPISTGMPGYETPMGCFMAYFGKEMHYSTQYNNAPMPYSIFFKDGAALHEGDVNVPSHGCVHIDSGAAHVIYSVYERYPNRFQVCVVE